MRFFIKKLLINWGGLFALVRVLEVYVGALYGRVHDPEYRRLLRYVALQNRPIRILDVGANLGQSMVTFSGLFKTLKLNCIEPNPKCHRTLQQVAQLLKIKKAKSDFKIFHGALWPSNRAADPFFVPVTSQGVEFLQEGSFDRTVFSLPETIKRIGSDFHLRSVKIPVVQPADLMSSYDIIKIDVQGTELIVIEWLESHGLLDGAVLIVENDYRNFANIFAKLSSLGFSCDQQWENSFFYPDRL